MINRFQLHGEVGLADALIALDGLDRNAELEVRPWLPDLLGIDLPILREAAAKPDQPEPQPESYAPAPAGTALRDLVEDRKRDLPPEPDQESPRHPPGHAPTVPSQLRWEEDPTAPSRDWYVEANPLPPAKELNFEATPPLRPLFERRRSRSLLSGALATRQPDGDLDLDAIIAQVTNLRPILDFPRLPVPTMRLGLQLLLDRGRGLLPYHRDQDLLVRDIEDIAGRDRVEILRFADHPLRGSGTGPRSDWMPSYRPPAPGVPVVLLTDLGICRTRQFTTGASVKEWLQFARLVRAAGCPLLAIVPAFPHRVARELRAQFRVLPWSRTTTIATVRGIIGRGLKTP